MTENGSGCATSSADERAVAAEGRADGLQLAMIGMMRVISGGQTGKDAYQTVAEYLQAQAKGQESLFNLPGLAGLRAQATHFQLNYLAGVFSHKPDK
jgi:hypothetical protein